MDFLAISLAILIGSLGFFFIIWRKPRKNAPDSGSSSIPGSATKLPVTIVYTSLKGTSKEFAERLKIKIEDEYTSASSKDYFSVNILDMKDYDPDNLSSEKFLIFVVSTYTNGLPPVSGSPFCNWLQDHSLDFRVQRDALTSTSFSILGLGNRLYCTKGHYNLVAKNIDFWLKNIGARRATSTFLADERDGLLDNTFDSWAWEVCSALEATYVAASQNRYATLRSVEEARRFAGELDDQQPAPESNEGYDDEDSEAEAEQRRTLPDLEDLNTVYTPERITSQFKLPVRNTEAELLNPRLRQSLGKQGYRLIGSHSGVKLCRWTKAMLRGRGGCYKHTFYGIKSYQCMEMTPSLACANKCVFCWRHHTNPVTREWRWKADEAKWLLEESIANHVSLINTLKGVPGVVPERFEEARSIRHCALSLVGEPIIYPHINEYIQLLHDKRISSFMVTNAQFPDKIEELKPVTQMYISIDAATKDSLQKIDRPLFTDFWERFLACIDALSRKGQRTVFRLTLVKDWNTDDILEYAKLVERGMPEFIEVKGVTYCGESNASDLTMKNVPYHHEVVAFCNALLGASEKLRDHYGIACEHEHSCCMLISHKKFYIDGRWNTWIDYDRFHAIIGQNQPFTSLDYCEPTPSWAVFGSSEKGFDPAEVRFMRKSKEPAQGGC